MEWNKTVASVCRYGDIAGRVFGPDCDVIWEDSEADYQGSAEVLVAINDGYHYQAVAHYEWSYGSCSGCDDWESRGLSDVEIMGEMVSGMVFFKDRETLLRYVERHTDLPAHSAGEWVDGEWVSEAGSMCEAAMAWLDAHPDFPY